MSTDDDTTTPDGPYTLPYSVYSKIQEKAAERDALLAALEDRERILLVLCGFAAMHTGNGCTSEEAAAMEGVIHDEGYRVDGGMERVVSMARALLSEGGTA